MAFKLRTQMLISIGVCILVSISTVSSKCCDDAANPACVWSGSWELHPSATPDVTNYPNFLLNSRSSIFYFIENEASDETSTTTFTISGEDTTISFDYFFDSPYADPLNYLSVYFTNSVTGFATLLTTISNPYAFWVYDHIVICNSTLQYCCGTNDFPCNGIITVRSTVNTGIKQALFGFDTIGTCGLSPYTTTTQRPCITCDFGVDNCIQASTGWQVGSTSLIPDSATHGNVAFTQVAGAQLTLVTSFDVTAATTFSFDYYVSASSGQATVYFFADGQPPYQIGDLSYSSGAWAAFSQTCTGCCYGAPTCNGNLAIQAAGIGFIVAVDNVVDSATGFCSPY